VRVILPTEHALQNIPEVTRVGTKLTSSRGKFEFRFRVAKTLDRSSAFSRVTA
jgi:hypothetical protein